MIYVRKQGFTLIELLVVIAIIAILAAILFPVFTTAREKGKQAACLHNEKQIGLGMMSYCGDWNDSYPLLNAQIAAGVNYDGVGHHPFGVFYMLERYISRNAGVLKCPSSVRYTGNISYLVNTATSVGQYLWGLQYGPWPSTYPYRFTYRAAKVSELKAPGHVVAVIDWHWSTAVGDFIPGMFGYYYGKPMHNGGKNFIFADGHAKWYKTEGIPFFMDKAWYHTYQPYKMSWRVDYQP